MKGKVKKKVALSETDNQAYPHTTSYKENADDMVVSEILSKKDEIARSQKIVTENYSESKEDPLYTATYHDIQTTGVRSQFNDEAMSDLKNRVRSDKKRLARKNRSSIQYWNDKNSPWNMGYK